jgi:KamA family protein
MLGPLRNADAGLAVIGDHATAPVRNVASARGEMRTYDRRRLKDIPQLQKLAPEMVEGIDLVARVLPFKVNQYVLDELIDWDNVPNDPIFRLTFPQREMLAGEDAERLAYLVKNKGPEDVDEFVEHLRGKMNPHPADQQLNAPFFEGTRLTGLQHKYRETVLFFAKHGQTCHSYCTFCFRWPQFVRAAAAPKFEANDGAELHAYLRRHEEVSDLLLTGGDPMIMNARRLREYLEPLLHPSLGHVQTIRIGTKALTYWPYRFLSDPDTESLLDLFRELIDGGKNIALMAHINHWREISTDAAQRAVRRLKQIGIVIRSQAPILRHINAEAETWRRNWNDQARLGIVPYYMFVERDTGPRGYFQLPLAQSLGIYREAISGVSGIARSARGPTMSAGPGKIEVLGTIEIGTEKFFLLTFTQARKVEWLRKPFLAKYSESACWLDHLEPPDGQNEFFFTAAYKQFVAAEAARADQHSIEPLATAA